MKRVFRFAAAGLLLATAGVQAGEVAASATEVRPLLIGAEVPNATIRTSDGGAVALDDLLAKQPTILILYRGGW